MEFLRQARRAYSGTYLDNGDCFIDIAEDIIHNEIGEITWTKIDNYRLFLFPVTTAATYFASLSAILGAAP